MKPSYMTHCGSSQYDSIEEKKTSQEYTRDLYIQRKIKQQAKLNIIFLKDVHIYDKI